MLVCGACVWFVSSNFMCIVSTFSFLPPFFMIILFIFWILWFFIHFFFHIGVNTIIVFPSLWHSLSLKLLFSSFHLYVFFYEATIQIALNKVRVHFYAFVYLLSHCYSSFWCFCLQRADCVQCTLCCVHKHKWRLWTK